MYTVKSDTFNLVDISMSNNWQVLDLKRVDNGNRWKHIGFSKCEISL